MARSVEPNPANEPAGEDAPARAGGSEPRLSRAGVGRLSLYLRRLESLLKDGRQRVSSGILGEAIGVTDAQVRKDLAALGNLGQPGIGYDTAELTAAIRRMLGIDREWRVALVGVGNLARALLGYRGFVERGFNIVALLDVATEKVGQEINGLIVQPLSDLPEILANTKAELGVLAVPVEAAQDVANQLVAAGIRGLLNFAPIVLRVPSHVRLVTVDLTVQLEQLAFLVQASRTDPEASDPCQ
jgi:redox-sensing transcriptional repressor